jgi:hypothetical protein
MIEVCPRCSFRLGSPLKSGRLVCANCGWSNDPAPVKPEPVRPKRSPFIEILTICSRIIRRTFAYVMQIFQTKMQDLSEARSSAAPAGKRLVEGLSDRLSALERAIPTEADGPRWLTLEEAFRYLGGDPADTNSMVSTESGATSLSYRRFRLLTSVADFKAFGLDADLGRRDAQKPWLRWTQQK